MMMAARFVGNYEELEEMGYQLHHECQCMELIAIVRYIEKLHNKFNN